MSAPAPQVDLLPHIRRVITEHDSKGVAVAKNDVAIPSEAMQLVPGARDATVWVITDGLPTNENVGDLIPGAGLRPIDNPENFNLVPAQGANLRSTELGPGVETPMHRTSSLDYNILVAGELVLITEDGCETRLSTPGDTVIQRGTLHAWRNPSTTQWARFISVLMSAEPAVVAGEPLKSAFIVPQSTQ